MTSSSKKPDESKQKPPSEEEKLQAALADADKWGKVALSPNLNPAEVAWVKQLQRSALAEARLRHKGLAYQEGKDPQAEVEQLMNLHSLPDQTSSTAPKTALSSIKPETSGST